MQKLTLQNRRNQNIVGILTQPEGNIIGTAVLQHGYGGVKEHLQIIALQDAFLKNGFQVFNFDSPNSFGESDGEYRDARLGLHADDFEGVANWVQNQSWFTGKLLVSGHSMGGFASARYALRNPEKVDFAIPFTPVISGELWREAIIKYQPDRLREWNETGEYIRKSQSTPGLVYISPQEVLTESLNHSLLSEDLGNPNILIIGCEKDTSCLPEHIQVFYEALKNNKEYKILTGAKHTPREPEQLEQLKNIVDSWFKDQ